MKKLQLDPDQIRVDRFETLAGESENGTVVGNAITNRTGCGTCYDSCATGGIYPCPYCP